MNAAGDQTAAAPPWRICRFARVRSAGFAYELLEPLRLVDVFHRCSELDALSGRLAAIGEVLDGLLAAHPTPWKTRVASLRKRVRRNVEAKELIREEDPAVHDVAAWQEAVNAWNALAEQRAKTYGELDALFDAQLSESRRHLWRSITETQLRDALFFSSPGAAVTLRSTAPKDTLPPRTSKIREREITAMMFVQRFCAKNDSISYYGPIYWGPVDDEHPLGVDFVHRSNGLVSRRAVSLEQWASASLAEAVSATPSIRPFLKPRIRPGFALREHGLFRADDVRINVSDQELKVLQLIEEGARVNDLVERAAPNVLESLEARGLVDVKLRVPAMRNSERLVMDMLKTLPEELPARAEWEQKLAAIAGHMERFAATPLDQHESRSEQFLEIERVFEGVVGRSSRRREGQVYAGRAILYEDCERNFERFVIGGDVVRDLRALAPLFDLASWTMNAFGEREHARYLSTYRALAESPGAAVPLYKLYRAALQGGAELAELSARRVEEIIEHTWSAYLDERHPGWRDARELTLEPDALSTVLSRLPAVKQIPDRNVFVQSPDVMIAAKSVDDIHHGNYRIILGELHKGVFVTVIPWATVFQSNRTAIEEDFAAWCGSPLMDLAPPDGNRAEANWPDNDLHRQVDHDSGCASLSSKRMVPIAELEVVEGEDGWLWIRSRSSTAERFFFLEVVRREFIRHLLSIEPISLPGANPPRLSWGRVVLTRRRWRIPAEELPSLPEQGFALFCAFRAWAAKLGLPEQIFARVPSEPKPFLIDFANYFSLEVLAKQMRKQERLSLSEMLPAPGDLWLTGPDTDARFTVELRFTMYRSAADRRLITSWNG